MPSDVKTVQEGVPRPPSDLVQITVRVPEDWLEQADTIAKAISRPGFEATRADALRVALARGLDELRAEAKKSRR